MRALSFAAFRTGAVLAGGAFVAITLTGACLDYAGEDWGKSACDPRGEGAEDAGADGGGCDAGEVVVPEGSGSGSASP